MKTPYRMNIDEVPAFKVAPPSQDKPSEIDVRMVYGTDTGMMIAGRQNGYHSRPHYHDAEQWNYVLDGEIWFFIGHVGFRCRKGDIIRVPRNEIHWTWVRSEQGCVMIETHTPSLTGDPALAKGAVPMVAAGEVPDRNGVNNIFVDYPQARQIEERALAADSER
ncbi:MAG TPA: cupin domain-containing protein [Xanthobacteraceae bacterium]